MPRYIGFHLGSCAGPSTAEAAELSYLLGSRVIIVRTVSSGSLSD